MQLNNSFIVIQYGIDFLDDVYVTLLVKPSDAGHFGTGFSSGLPLLLIGSTLKAWLHDDGINLTTIGLFAFVGLPYTLKFIWAP